MSHERELRKSPTRSRRPPRHPSRRWPTSWPPPISSTRSSESTSSNTEAVVDTEEVPEGLAGFPPLARVLVEGERVSLEEMEDVLEEREPLGSGHRPHPDAARALSPRPTSCGAWPRRWASSSSTSRCRASTSRPPTTSPKPRPGTTTSSSSRSATACPWWRRPTPPTCSPWTTCARSSGATSSRVVATRSQISTYIDKAYHQGGDASEVATAAASDFEDIGDEGLGNIQAVVDDAPIVRYVNLLVLQALNERASDIHVEPTGENLRIRYRIDGVLHDISTAPRAIASAVTTRLKVMADLNIAEHRLPQDGRLSLTVGNRPIDLRMATLPTIYGEKVVMRVLDKTNVVLGFEDLGFDPDLMEIYQELFNRPYGTILVTGPTGSGKTTTLYATLAALNNPEKNIITVEDPVELRIKGISQVQLNVKAGLTFAAALRSILRSDPDIVLVGEIRDRETALISIEAALTGHMVLATLHTNNSASTPMRLVEMGIEPYLVTSAITGALGPAAGPPAVRALPRALRRHRGRHRGGGLEAGRGLRGRHNAHVVPGGGLPGLFQHRIPGAQGAPRAPRRHRRRGAVDHRGRYG